MKAESTSDMIAAMKNRDWIELLSTLGHDPSLPLNATSSPATNSAETNGGWRELHAAAITCVKCDLNLGRTNVVFGSGSTPSPFMFVGEGPGLQEDQSGEPFVGEAGQLLNKMVAAMGLNRDSVYVTNVIKCRPPNNRNPLPEEISKCTPFLEQQIKLLKPKWIIALGTLAAQYLLDTEQTITLLRGKIHTEHRWSRDDTKTETIKIISTFHPTYLLRNPEMKKACWEDLQLVMQDAGLGARN